MATVDIQTALQAIQQGKIDSLYYLVGEERYFSNQCLRYLRHSVVSGELSEFNEDIFYATDVSLEKVAESLQTLPVLSDSRLVILKEAHLLTEKEWAHLDEAYEHLFKTASSDKINLSRKDESQKSGKPSCVFVIQASQVDRRKKVIKKWLDQATVIECQTPKETARAPWIRHLAKEKGLALDQEALAYMVQMGGNNLEELDRDLEKIFLFFGGPHSVTIGDLAQILQRNREESIFSLSESVGKKDRTQALFLFRNLKAQGESEIALVALVARHLRILLKLKKGQEIGSSGAVLATQAGINNYFMPQYLQQARLWTQEQLSGSLIQLSEVDRQLKSSSLSGELWFERFLIFGERTMGPFV